MILKVCGNTLEKQVLEMSELGVNYLGFIFVKKSPRYISPNQAQIILQKNKIQAKSVGVFLNHSISEVIEIQNKVNLDLIQLHGTESVAYVEELKAKTSAKIIKVIGVDENFNPDILDSYHHLVEYFLFDSIKKSKSKTIRGGTGEKFNWILLKNLNISTPWILAGGIGPEEIPDAIFELKKYGLAGFDINSKVEFSPGDKNIELVKKALDTIKP